MKHILFILILFLSILKVNAQQQVRGTVIDVATGQPLAGATIKWDGGKTTTTSDVGVFTLSLANGSHLIKITYLNYKSQDTLLQVPLSGELVVKLTNTIQELQTVEVSTGYQTLPKERSTGSFAQISNAKLNEQVSADVISRLEGVVNGLTVDRKMNGNGGYGIMIRGLSTIRGPRSPLIVLDNFPYEGDLNNINPNDVESITVLKDAAAASIWGAKAGNGVIVITTKKAKFNQKLKVAFNSNIRITESPDLYYKSSISVSSFIDVENMLFDKGYYTSTENSTSRGPLSEVVEIRITQRDGLITAQEATNRINAIRQYDLRQQMDQYMYQNAVAQQYAVQLNGGSENRNWLVSGGFDRNVSDLDAPANRYNLRLEQTQKITPRLTATGRIYLTHSSVSGGKPDMQSLEVGGAQPYSRIADENGNALPMPRNYRMKYLAEAGNGKLLNWFYYPLDDYKAVDATTTLNNALASVSANYQVLDGLKATVTYQYQQQEQNADMINGQDAYFTRNLINQFSQIDAGGNVKRIIPLGSIRDVNNILLSGYNLRGQIDFTRNFNKHNISAIAGAEINSTTIKNNTYTLYGVNDETLTTSLIDYVNPYRNFITGSNSYIPNKDGLDETVDRGVSLYANAAYTYDTRYTLSLSARRDASNLYGLNTNDKWNPLFSVGMSWNVSNEKFFKVDAIPYLKLRATYGASGNTDPSMVAVTTIAYAGSASTYTQSPFAPFNSYANPELRWERVYMFNAGIDFGLKNNRLSGSIEYYRKRSVDLFGLAPVDPTVGIGSTIIKNASEIAVKGLDIELNSINIKGKFTWTSNFFINLYRDKVLKNNLLSLAGRSFTNGNLTAAALPGKPAYSLFSYKFAGLDPATGDPLGYVNGVVSKDYAALTATTVLITDLAYHGTAIPIYSGALGNGLSYGGFSLNFRISYKLGYYFRKPTIDYYNLYALRKGNGDFEKRWQKPGDELITSVPSMIYPGIANRDAFYGASEATVVKGDHIRLQYINLAYDLKLKQGNKFMLTNAQFFVVANNLGILWRANKDHIDPDYTNIPASRNIAVGLKANF